MTKKLWIGGSVVLILAATGALVYANHQAELYVAAQIKDANQQYKELAELGEMPPFQLAYQDLSANVLTSHYKVHGLTLSMDGMGAIASVELVDLKGVQLSGMPSQSTARLEGIRIADAVLQGLPPELSAYLQQLTMGLNYQYQYDAHLGELNFSQQLLVQDKLELSYQFSLGGMQPLWGYAEELQKLSPEQQQQRAEQEDYLPELMQKVGQASLIKGQVQIDNHEFWQQLTGHFASAGFSADFATLQTLLLAQLDDNPQLPDAIRQPLQQFIQQPEQIRLSFEFAEPVSFASMQDGTAMQGIESTEQLLEKAGFVLEAKTF